MQQYSFTCPLEGCGLIMTTQANSTDEAAKALVAQAEQHLRDVHPDVHKTHEEVDQDIRAHMVMVNE